jgi:Alpha galactosidase C-terminal beta sandwich domain/Ricin-type beta-trefoil lectin domain
MSAISTTTLDILKNPDALSVSEDPLGIQGRRVAVFTSVNNTLSAPWDANAVIGLCDAGKPTQNWVFHNSTQPGPPTQLYMETCSITNPMQTWSLSGGLLKNLGSGLCVDRALSPNGCSTLPGQVTTCNSSSPTQQWTLLPQGQIQSGNDECLDIPYGIGPACSICTCHPPGTATNQEWTLTADGLLQTAAIPNTCLAITNGPQGGTLSTTDENGNDWCLQSGSSEGTWTAQFCNVTSANFLYIVPIPSGPQPLPGNPGNYSLTATSGGLGYSNQAGASGPWPHTRWMTQGSALWTVDFNAAQSPTGTSFMVADQENIIDDDLIGNVTIGGKFCLDLTTSGILEVWAGPLVNGGIAVSMINRSPASAPITAFWKDIGATAGTTYQIRDVWMGANLGPFTDSYTTMVASRDVSFLILTPQ